MTATDSGTDELPKYFDVNTRLRDAKAAAAVEGVTAESIAVAEVAAAATEQTAARTAVRAAEHGSNVLFRPIGGTVGRMGDAVVDGLTYPLRKAPAAVKSIAKGTMGFGKNVVVAGAAGVGLLRTCL